MMHAMLPNQDVCAYCGMSGLDIAYSKSLACPVTVVAAYGGSGITQVPNNANLSPIPIAKGYTDLYNPSHCIVPDIFECQHEYVNVGFTSVKEICKKCDKEKV